MTNKYLSGAYPAGYYFNNPNYTGLLIESTGSIGGTGVIANRFISQTIQNFGTVNATAPANEANGILGYGEIINGSAANTSALIAGTFTGIFALGPATVDNFGTIAGYRGILMPQGGVVTNGSAADTTAQIRFGKIGVYAEEFATITNYGTISGTISSGQEGVGLTLGGTVTNGSAIDTTALISGPFGVFANSPATISNFGTITGTDTDGVHLIQGGTVTNGSAGDATALISGPTGVYAKRNAVTTVINYGTIAGTGGTAVQFNSNHNVLEVEAGSTFLGAVLGEGSTLDLASSTIGTITNMTGGNVTVSGSMPTTTFTAFGTLEIGAGAQFTLEGSGTIASGATAVLVDNGVFTDTFGLDVAGAIKGTGTLVFEDRGQTLNAGASVTVSNWSLKISDTTSVDENLSYAGAFNEDFASTLTIGSADTMTFTGATTLGGAVNGMGTLAFAGGAQALNRTASLSMGDFLTSGAAVTSVNAALTYTGAYSLAATVTIAAGDRLNLTGASSLSQGSLAGTVNGAGTLKIYNTTVGALTIGGTADLWDGGNLDQTGEITLGDSASKAARLTVVAGANLTIENDSGIAAGGSKQSHISLGGLLIKSGGTGVSVIGVNVENTGSIVAASGTLDLAGVIAGPGNLTVDAGATLEADSKVEAGGSTMVFNGGGTLALSLPSKFAATITDFASGDTIDLLNITATSATLAAGDRLVIRNGTKAVAALQLSGDYTGDTFTVASDGAGGSDVTVSTGASAVHPNAGAPPPHRFIAAMAGLGNMGGLSIHLPDEGQVHQLVLANPRVMAA